ncbi:MAG: glycerol-3-phosphate 1-O-acyltransferase PlsY [Armatimonadota bacterium]
MNDSANPGPLLATLLSLGAFFLGAIPFGFVAGKLKGIDLREEGSKNIGATNTLRVLGPVAGVVVLLLDVLKGLIPVLVARQVLHLPSWWVVGVGLLAVLGHIYSPFVRFRGGKGVATSLGVLFGLSPLIAGATVALFALVVVVTRFVSLGSLLGAVLQGVLFWVLPPAASFAENLPYRLFSLVVALFVIVRHRENIKRLLKGTENRFGTKKEEAAPQNSDETEPAKG